MSDIAFGAAISEDRSRAAVVAAGYSKASGKVLVDLSPFYGHPRDAVARIEELYERHDPVAVVVNPKAQSVTLVRPLADAGIIVTQMTAEEVAVAHGEFLDLVSDGQLEHLGQEPLTAAVRSAQQRPLVGAKAWDPRVGVDQSPLVAATGAVWGLRKFGTIEPGAWVL